MIKNKIQSKLSKAFDRKLTDAIHSFTCKADQQSGEYDPVTQTYPIQTIKEYSGRGVLFGSYAKDLVKPTDYQVEDCKAVVLQNEVTAKPEIGEVWRTDHGHYRIISLMPDAAGATLIVQLRKTTEQVCNA